MGNKEAVYADGGQCEMSHGVYCMGRGEHELDDVKSFEDNE
jgi:hypothetical protein